MNDIAFHLGLFLLAGTVIVVIGALFSEPDDRTVLRVLPKRWLHFFIGCGIVIALMLLAEHTLASIH